MEVGHKMSMMGIYTGELHVSLMPVFLSKLSIAVFCSTEIKNPFKSVKIRITSGDNVLIETDIPQADLDKMQTDVVSKNSAEDPIKSIALGMQFNITPFAIEKEATIVATVIADGEEMIAGKLRIKHTPNIA